MKKLMIAAAVAAMVGGAYADMVFDFTAKVTTTKAKQGGQTKKTVNIGHDGTFNWWYDEAAVFAPNADPNYLDYIGLGGPILKAAKKDKTGVFKIQLNQFKTNEDKANLAEELTVNYGPYDQPDIYKGKQKFCFSFSYTVAGTCIRAKGSETIQTWFDDAAAGCCAAAITPTAPLVLFEGFWDKKAKVYTPGQWLLGDMTILTLYRFGNVLGTKCSNIEAVGYIGAEGIGATPYTTIPQFAIAGQGTWGRNTAADQTFDTDAIQKLSGNIVGIWYEAECEVCCGADKSSLAWACDLSAHNINTFVDSEFSLPGNDAFMGLARDAGWSDGLNEWGTAAFGTFTLTFNKTASWGL